LSASVNPNRPILRLREWRTRRALSQQDLGELAGIGRATIARIEEEKQFPRPRTLRKLAMALGIKPEKLFQDPFT